MDKYHKGQEPAFPQFLKDNNNPNRNDGANGMSKRFYAACAAMQGLLASTNSKSLFVSNNSDSTHFIIEKSVAEMAYLIADELLKQENL